MTPAFDAIAPHPDGVDAADELIHERAYVVRAYRNGADKLVLRGAVRDQKPPGLYIADDPEPLTIHHMIVDLTIAIPSLEIIAAKAVLEMHPHPACTRIEDHYDKLVGLSIARGFTHKVRELFGGPRGCTHTTALLQAMAPVAIQSMWSFNMAQRASTMATSPFNTDEARQASADGQHQHVSRVGRGRRPCRWAEERRTDGRAAVDLQAVRRARSRPIDLARLTRGADATKISLVGGRSRSPPLTRSRSAGDRAKTSCQVPAAAQTSSYCNRSGSMKTRSCFA